MGCILSSPAGLHKLQKHNVGDGKDMINNLPDDILPCILSFLPIKDAVRTSILATNWRYLWTNVSVIDFEIGHVKSNNSKSADYLLDQVDELLHKSNCVERLCVKTQGGSVGVGKVSTFISSVVKHKVQDLEISLEHLEGRYVLPNKFTASYTLNKLHLEFPHALYIPSGISFPGLKTLVVSKVYFGNEKSVERLFLGCPVLQELTLEKCYWRNLKNIHIAISTLRKLTIYSDHWFLDYNDSDKFTITIDVENLLSLRCTSKPEVEFFLVKPTSIVDANIDLGCCNLPDKKYSGQCAIELFSGLSSLKSLSLSDDFLRCLEYSKDTLHHLPSFQNLTHLFLRTNTFTSEVVMDILLKTPNLKALHFRAGSESFMHLEDDWTLLSVPCCFEYSLKSFCVSDFRGLEQHIQFINFVLKNAKVLEKIRIVCSSDISTELDNIRSQLEAVVPKSCLMTFL